VFKQYEVPPQAQQGRLVLLSSIINAN